MSPPRVPLYLQIVDTLQGLYEPDMQPDRLSDYEAMRVHIYRDTEIIRDIQKRYYRRGFGTASQDAQRLGSSGDGWRTGLAVLNPAPDPYILAKAARSYARVRARNEVTLEGSWVSISDVPVGDFGLDLKWRLEFD